MLGTVTKVSEDVAGVTFEPFLVQPRLVRQSELAWMVTGTADGVKDCP